MLSMQKLDKKLIETNMDEDDFDDFLDQCYEPIDVMGHKYDFSHVLKKVDNVRWQMMKNDYESQEDEENPQYKYLCPTCHYYNFFDDEDDDDFACCQGCNTYLNDEE